MKNLLFIIIFAFPFVVSADLTTNLVSYWDNDETSGVRVDSHGSNDLTDNNTVLYGTGILSNGADFEYANNEYLSITDASQSGLDILGNLSISLWVKFESFPATNEKWYPVYKNDAYMLRLPDDVGGSRSINMYFRDGAGFYNASVSWSPSLATMYHVVVTREASTGYVKFYVNGSQQGTTQATGRTANLLNSADVFHIGGAYGGIFDGILDEVGIWDKVLSSTEVTELYNSGAGLAYPFSSPPPPVVVVVVMKVIKWI